MLEDNVFKITKKKSEKDEKKSFPLYMDIPVLKELDKVAKKTGYSRNELINMMIQRCLNNLEITEE
jgi:metal-responsive CopG/Arc/MetJ family transcriptional regulator